jgi:transcriptional regulator with XRE-family HTH domain
MARHKFSELRQELEARPGAKERLAEKRAETLEEIRLYELRHAEAVSQAELAGRLEVTQGAVSKFEHADDVRVSTLRQYLEALGARLELMAVFDDEDRRVPLHLGGSSTGSSTGPIGTDPDRATRTRRTQPRKASSQARTGTNQPGPARRSDHS